jgi:hypothetical protein
MLRITNKVIHMHQQHFAVIAAAISAFGLSGCANDSPEHQCYEAALAYAQATEKFIDASHKTTKDAWLQAHVAAKQWMDKVCPKPNY